MKFNCLKVGDYRFCILKVLKLNVPTTIAMLTDDKITKIFCIADDFCKVFNAQMAKYTLRNRSKRE